MLVEADRTGCLREVLVITAAMSVQDPRERPAEQRQAADEKHARFTEHGSDFLAFLHLWRYVASSVRSCPATGSAGCSATSSCTTCASASGRTCTHSCGPPPATPA